MTKLKATLLDSSSESLEIAAKSLESGEILGMPTETVYGLAGNAFSESALARIFESKERPKFDPLILHISDRNRSARDLSEQENLADLSGFSQELLEKVDRLIENFWPGPLTLVLPKKAGVLDLATSGLPTVAIRMPNHPVALALLNRLSFPLAAPSANRFGRISPTSARDVMDELGDRIPYILDGGQSRIGIESTVIAVNPSTDIQSAFTLLRPGGVSVEELQKVLETQVSLLQPQSGKISAPGMLLSHYAPRKTLHLLPKPIHLLKKDDLEKLSPLFESLDPEQPVGVLLFNDKHGDGDSRFREWSGHSQVHSSVLSSEGNLSEAANRLFQELRRLDASPAQVLFTEPCPSREGLGFGITDRLKRASYQSHREI